MKKLIGMLGIFLLAFTFSASAQETKTKVKPVTTVGDKAHNVIHPKHKRYSGVKIKHKTAHSKRTTKVKNGKVTTEIKKED